MKNISLSYFYEEKAQAIQNTLYSIERTSGNNKKILQKYNFLYYNSTYYMCVLYGSTKKS
jgi:hypothetical protein